jgi:hypothetical protein
MADTPTPDPVVEPPASTPEPAEAAALPENPSFAHVDEQGVIVTYAFAYGDDFVLPEGHLMVPLPDDYWEIPYAWDGAVFTPDVKKAQDTKWEEVKAKREIVQNSGCMTPKGKMDSTKDSRDTIGDAVAMADKIETMAPGTFLQPWTMFNNSSVDHNLQELTAAALALGFHVARAHAVGTALRNQIYGVIDPVTGQPDPAFTTTCVEAQAIDVEAAPWPPND